MCAAKDYIKPKLIEEYNSEWLNQVKITHVQDVGDNASDPCTLRR